MYQLIKAIFKNPNDKTKVSLVYGNVTHPPSRLRVTHLIRAVSNAFCCFEGVDVCRSRKKISSSNAN